MKQDMIKYWQKRVDLLNRQIHTASNAVFGTETATMAARDRVPGLVSERNEAAEQLAKWKKD